MDPAQVAMLQNVLRQESRSLLQYAAESFPWTKAEDQAACDTVRAMAAEETAAVAKLGRWLAKQHFPLTFPGAYPINFTTTNFIALSALLPRLVNEQRQRIAALEMTAASMTDGMAQIAVQPLVDLKRAHLQELSALQSSTSSAAIAS